jgi:hypothetical protein
MTPQADAVERLIAEMSCVYVTPCKGGVCSACRAKVMLAKLQSQLSAAEAKAEAWDAVGSDIEAAGIGYNAPQIVRLVTMLRAAEARVRALEAEKAPVPVTEAAMRLQEHVCGLQGWCPGPPWFDAPCPACEANRAKSAASPSPAPTPETR